jgi:hypothetical protein
VYGRSPSRRRGGQLRTQFHHVVDIAQTILGAVGLPEPTVVHGVEQAPMEGVSLLYTIDDAMASERHETQYFEILCNRGVYHRGWTAVTRHRIPWDKQADPKPLDEDVWELHGPGDWTQAHDIASAHPDKLSVEACRRRDQQVGVGASQSAIGSQSAEPWTRRRTAEHDELVAKQEVFGRDDGARGEPSQEGSDCVAKEVDRAAILAPGGLAGPARRIRTHSTARALSFCGAQHLNTHLFGMTPCAAGS